MHWSIFRPVHQRNVLRDKPSIVSHGCLFFTFHRRKHAFDKQNSLHKVNTTPCWWWLFTYFVMFSTEINWTKIFYWHHKLLWLKTYFLVFYNCFMVLSLFIIVQSCMSNIIYEKVVQGTHKKVNLNFLLLLQNEIIWIILSNMNNLEVIVWDRQMFFYPFEIFLNVWLLFGPLLLYQLE